jgi:hypothetical protein
MENHMSVARAAIATIIGGRIVNFAVILISTSVVRGLEA